MDTSTLALQPLAILDESLSIEEAAHQAKITKTVRANLAHQQWKGELARVPDAPAPPLPRAGQRAHLRQARKNYADQLKPRGRNRAQRRQLARRVNLDLGGES